MLAIFTILKKKDNGLFSVLQFDKQTTYYLPTRTFRRNSLLVFLFSFYFTIMTGLNFKILWHPFTSVISLTVPHNISRTVSPNLEPLTQITLQDTKNIILTIFT
jgi:hypothetical protein